MRKKFYTALALILKQASKELGDFDFSILAASITELLEQIQKERKKQ